MKKITLLLFFISFSAFSQIHFLTHQDEKISYSEYDNFKYIASIHPNFSASENIKRYYDNGKVLLYSTSELSSEDKTCVVYIYPSGTIEYTITLKIKGQAVTEQGTLKINGVNYFLSITSCNEKTCECWVFVNKEQVYKGNAEILKK